MLGSSNTSTTTTTRSVTPIPGDPLLEFSSVTATTTVGVVTARVALYHLRCPRTATTPVVGDNRHTVMVIVITVATVLIALRLII